MVLNRPVPTDFWINPKVNEEYSLDDKLLYIYLITNEHLQQLGIYKISKKIIAIELDMDWAVFRNTNVSDKYFRCSNSLNVEELKRYMAIMNQYYDVQIFEGTFNEETKFVNYKMDPYYELLRIARKNKNRTMNLLIYVYGYHKANENVSDYDNDLSSSEMFLKAAFIEQISDGKIIMRDDVHGLLDNPQEESINWRRILE